MSVFRMDPDSICFVDTNIWLYAFIQGQDAEKTRIAKTVVEECDVVVSTQIVNETCVNPMKKIGFSEIQIRDLIASFYQRYNVCELSRDILLKASKIRDGHGFSFWDSLVVASALDCDANYLLTEDMQSGFLLEDRLKIMNPFIQIP